MAAEISVTQKLTGKKGTAFATSFPDSISFTDDMTGTNLGNNTQNVGTTVEEIVLGDINAGANKLGWFWVKNLSSTNYVEISYGDATSTNFADRIIAKVSPGKSIICYAPSTRNNIYGKANTAAVDVAWCAIQV